MIKVSFAENPLLNETQVLGRVLSQFRYLYYFWKKRLRSTNFQEDKKFLLSRDEMALLEMPFLKHVESRNRN